MHLKRLTLVIALFCCQLPLSAKSYDVGVESQSQYVQAKPFYAPEPKIPPTLQEDCLKTYCVARFTIQADGKATVKLLTSSGSDDMDDMTLKTLEQWKFKPASLDGKAVASTRKIKIEFQVD